MNNSLILQDKNYISARQAGQIFGYATDYIGQLCREGKLECTMIGRSWFVSEESIKEHKLGFRGIVKSADSEKTYLPHKEITLEQKIITNEKVPLDKTPLSYLPAFFTLPNQISSTFLMAPNQEPATHSSELIFTSVFCMVSLFFLLQSLGVTNTIVKNVFNNQLLASVVTISQTAFQKIESKAVAIVPSSNSVTQDEVVKESIRNTFSDEVTIKPDSTGSSGVITPMFKTTKGNDFLYVLVPVKETK